ncbi:hypothetical protein NP233_g2666 [Leucocoprinus birnbaumii]|uniref:Xaa-Pro aminopeptidase P n=1 Tax=Leucocoprinus birnbaumii TaxID=56174 RepID=A0AAD5VXX0_9AGAR|nr:hypothetical protein NP233_g2666 [Leucocoprinus birnbaumii]
MSFPYGQFTAGDNYSAPTTPIDGFPQWETVEREQEQQLQQQSQQQQSQEQSQQQLHHSPTQPTPTFQLIHLEESHSQALEPSSQPSGSLESGAVDNAPIHLHHIVHVDPPRSVDVRLEASGNELFSALGYSDYKASSSSASASANVSGATKQATSGAPSSSSGMVMRSARSTRQFAHQSTHPYQRPATSAAATTPGAGLSSSGTAAAGPSTTRGLMREAQVSGPGPLRFVHHNLLPNVGALPIVSATLSSGGAASAPVSVVPSAMPSPAIPSPVASTSGRFAGSAGSVAGSPVVQLQQSTLMHASPLIPDTPQPAVPLFERKKYIIRADTHYEPEKGVQHILLELPGVQKKDVKLSLVTVRHSRARQLKVSGISDSTLPAPSADVMRLFPESCTRERKFGEFSRTFTVPPDLKNIRRLMRQNGVDAYIVPTDDQHSSEYVADCDMRRAYISGFTGSAGTTIVTLTEAFFIYRWKVLLAGGETVGLVVRNWTLMKQGLPDVPTWQEFLHKNLPEGSKIGIDASLISAQDAESITKQLEPLGSKLVSVAQNLVDEVWGQSPAEKVAKVREEMKKKKAKAVVVTMLDEVAWLFNLRGSDIDYNPVFFSYAIVTEDNVSLFINANQVNEAAHKYLDGVVDILPYETFLSYLKDKANELQLDRDNKIWIASQASLAVAEAIGKDRYLIERSPVNDLKSIKNATELEGFRQCHIRDGVALARYFAWLEEQLTNGVELNESQGADQLEKFRKELDFFQGLSFTTISSTGPNGAIIHYSPDPTDCAIIKRDQIYLCDSGAQFLDGTTDVTRTWHFGTPTSEEKVAFTRVLQGHISIDAAVFPNGTTGFVIDSWARRYLWKDGLDYRHGTGHGVGHFLNVHEGPHGLGVRIAYNSAPLKVGMTLSNEPGYYEDGKYGIRLENIVLVCEAKTPHNFGDKGYLGFERVTMSPIHKKLINVDLLSVEEREWVDNYHAEVWQKVSPLLQHDARALEWLRRETTPLQS